MSRYEGSDKAGDYWKSLLHEFPQQLSAEQRNAKINRGLGSYRSSTLEGQGARGSTEMDLQEGVSFKASTWGIHFMRSNLPLKMP